MKSSPSRYKWAVVGMLWFVCLFNYADRQAIFSVFPKLKEEFGFNAVQLGLIASAFMWVYALGAPVAGFIADRLSRKHLIIGGCFFWSCTTLITGACSKLWQFIVVRALEGVGETFYFPSSLSLVSDYHDKRTRSKAFSFHQSSVYVGTIGGSWLGAFIAEHYNWRLNFFFFGIAGMVLCLLLSRFLREPERGAADRAAAMEENLAAAPETAALGPMSVRELGALVLKKPTALLLMSVFMGANLVATVFLTWTPTFLVDKFGFKLTTAGLSGSVFIYVASAFSAPMAGVLADRLARKFAGGRILVQAGGLLLGASFVALVGLTKDVTTLLVGMALFGFCKGVYDSNIFASLYDVVEHRGRATAAGVMNTVGWSGGALGPLLVGFATQYGRHESAIENMSEAIAFGSVIYVIGAALLILAATVFVRRDSVVAAAPSTCFQS